MKRSSVLALLALLVSAALAYAFWPRTQVARAREPAVPAAEQAVAAPEPAVPPAASALTLAERRERAERAVVAARAARESAVAELAAAEAEREEREREVERLEQFIADLKARGEDPVEHAEDGLALFKPAFENYQATALRIERAQATLQAAEAGLSSAEQSLAGLESETGSAPD